MKKTEFKEGMKVKVKGFFCIPDGTIVELKKTDANEFYINCDKGQHFLCHEDSWPEIEPA